MSDWDVASGKNIKWKTAIPGIANSSPIVWGNRVFVTTAISKAGDTTFRTGAYGDVKPVDDLSPITSGRSTASTRPPEKCSGSASRSTGAPKTKRHTKASQANSTPATDGRRVVAAFGSAGLLVAWDMTGKELWRADLGTIDSGWFFDPTYQWGHASSPVIYGNSVIVQADMQKGSYLAAWDLATGKALWKTPRPDEISTWGTPALARTADGQDVLVTNGTKIRGYDPKTGSLVWTLGPNSEVTVATPVAGHGLVFVTGGYPPVRPIYAIRPGARGDISLAKDQTAGDGVAWSNSDRRHVHSDRRSSTAIICSRSTTTACLPPTTRAPGNVRSAAGWEREARSRHHPSRPMAACSSPARTAKSMCVTAGPGLAQIAKNDMKEVIMATPAIADGMIIVRTLGHVYAIGQ